MRSRYFPSDKKRSLEGNIYWFFFFTVVSLFLLLLRAWYLQVVHGAYYLGLSENNRIRTVEIPPVRGQIYDRNGALLVKNVPSFTLYLVVEDMGDRENQRRVMKRLSTLIQIPEKEVSARLAENGRDPYGPIKIREDLSMEGVARIEGHRLELPGVKIEAEFKRHALYGEMAAHLLGYVGEISAEQLSEGKFQNVTRGSIIGQYGIEQTYDASLRGASGEKRIEVDVLGHERKVVEVIPPQPGDDLFLTLDLKLQKAAESALSDRPGTVVVVRPDSGEILAMVSHPAFDLNLLSRGISSKVWKRLLEDEEHPLTNRVIQGQYPPGSIFKIILSTAILETNAMSPLEQIECNGQVQFGNRNYLDWKKEGHGQVDLHRSLVESCDVYYYKLGRRLGIDKISEFALLFGLGKPTGIDLAFEKGGLIPNKNWKREVRHEPWFPGETLSASIGQGFVSTTPLQLAGMISAVANNGILNRPHLLKGTRNHETGELNEVPLRKGRDLKISNKTLTLIRDALAGVVSEPAGTGKRSRLTHVAVGGKTGTAQVVGRKGETHEDLPEKLQDHAWFAAFAPIEKPEIAVVVLVENGGHGGVTAAPIAQRVFEAYFGEAVSSSPRKKQADLG